MYIMIIGRIDWITKTKLLLKMERNLFSFLMVIFALFLLNTIFVGFDVISSYIENNQPKPEHYKVISYENFYQEMVEMERNSTFIFDEFPAPLRKIAKHVSGDTILISKNDTLNLVFRDLNRRDRVNRYPYYIMKDSKNNLWSLFRYDDEFHLKREDEVKHRYWIQYRAMRPD